MPLIFEPKLTILSCIAFKSLKFNSTKKSRTHINLGAVFSSKLFKINELLNGCQEQL
jgi:hypothetical protein